MAGILGENLISYKEVMEFLETKGMREGKGKNFFDTLRSRHKLIHKPITRPPIDFSIKEMDIKIRKGRSVYYLREIIPYLEKIIRLKDDNLTFREIEGRMQQDKQRLDKLRELELTDDKRLKPAEFLDLFKIATIKMQQYIGWSDSSKEKNFLEHVLKERTVCGKQYFELTERLREAARNNKKNETDSIESKREAVGRKMDFYHQIMESVVERFKILIKGGEIKMLAEDWKDVMEKSKKW